MLSDLILDENKYQKDSDIWKTHIRKRMLALMLYIHFKLKNKRTQMTNFFDIWKIVYPLNPLP